MSALNRINLLSSHLLGHFDIPWDPTLDDHRKSFGFTKELNDSLRNFFYSPGVEVYNEVIPALASMRSMDNLPEARQGKDEIREKLMKRFIDIKKVLATTREEQIAKPIRNFAITIVTFAYDMSLLIKAGVHFGIYADAIEYIGTSKHHPVLQEAFAFDNIGCFGLTELGHGSNVSAVETTAVFCKETRKFTLNSPTPTSAKWWIGGAGKTSHKSVIFAQMYVDGVNQGPQAFLIDIRNKSTLQPLDGVILGDCGHKNGNNGIDNGFILFRNYKVDYDSLLDRFSWIDSNGKFHTSIKKKEKRLGIMLSSLMRGRASCVIGSQMYLLNALAIAIRYSAVRRQFSSGSGPEVPILSYPLTRTRLMPNLSNLFAVLMSNHIIVSNYSFIRSKMQENHEAIEVAEFHATLSSLKALTTDWAFAGISECRKVCGGLGYSHLSRLGQLLSDHDVSLTWEGDNNVLLQQTSGFVVKQSISAMQGKPIEAASLKNLHLDFEEIRNLRASPELTVDNLIVYVEHLLDLLLHRALKELQVNSARFEEYFEVWNASQPCLQKLGKVYGILQISKVWRTRVAEEKDGQCAKVVEELLELFLLDKVKEYFSVLVADGFFDSKDCERLEKEWVRACGKIGDKAVQIIDAVALGDEAIGSVLGCRDGQVYRRMTQALESQGCYEEDKELTRVVKELLK